MRTTDGRSARVYRAFKGSLVLAALLGLATGSCAEDEPVVGPPPAAQKPAALTPAAAAAPAPVAAHPLARLPLTFVENRGQTDPRARFYVQGKHTSVFFADDGLTYALTTRAAAGPGRGTATRWAVKLDFVGARLVAPVGRAVTPGVVSYFRGRPEQWQTGLRTYAELVYRDLWPGIDLVFSGSQHRLKHAFIVHPGADPAQIRFAYRGAGSVVLGADGRIDVQTPAGGFQDDAPIAWTRGTGPDVAVAVQYAARGDGTRFGFQIGSYDPSRTLVVDPAVFVYAGFIGGAGKDQGHSVAVDGAGNSYVAGFTDSAEASFPDTVGPDPTFNGGDTNVYGYGDAFVAKIAADGTALVYAGYIGGAANDSAHAIAVDGSGNAYVVGETRAAGANSFPTTVGPDTSYNGGVDAFVVKVNASGTSLDYAGFVGGSGTDFGYGVAVDAAGQAYVAGVTESSEATFPDGDGFGALTGPDTTLNPIGFFGNGFIAKVNAAGSGLVYAGYIGGHSAVSGVAVDGSGRAYVTGVTDADGTNAPFPVTGGPDLSHNGGFDAFVGRLAADGTSFEYLGYIGGSGNDSGHGLAIDASGAAYVTGEAGQGATGFPDGDGFGTVPGPDQTYGGDYNDAFVAKVKADGSGLDYAGFIGGASLDNAWDIAVDAAGNAYVTGDTYTNEATFPVVSGPDLTFDGQFDGYVARVKADGTGFDYVGYISGTGPSAATTALGIAVDGAGNAYVAGYVLISGTGFPARIGPDLTYNGDDRDAFITRISLASNSTPAGSQVAAQPTDSTSGGTPVTVVYDTVTSGGTTSLATSTSGPAPPTGFQVGTPATYYEISTTATYSGTIRICIAYGGISFNQESKLKLFHHDGTSWVDVTTSIDTVNDVICGEVASLSPFGLFEQADGTPPTVTCSFAVPQLLTPHHNLVDVGLAAALSDDIDTSPTVQSVQVFADEDDQASTGKKQVHSPDAKDIAIGTLRLRAERTDSGNGRVYLVVVKAVDDGGNLGFDCCTVVVPKGTKAAAVANVESQATAARTFCEANAGAAPSGYHVIGDGPVLGPKQ